MICSTLKDLMKIYTGPEIANFLPTETPAIYQYFFIARMRKRHPDTVKTLKTKLVVNFVANTLARLLAQNVMLWIEYRGRA